MGNLGPQLKSDRMYDLGRIKRRLSNFSEAEQLMKASLSLEESLSGPSTAKAGRRLAELCADLAGQDKWAEGLQYAERLLPLADFYSGGERSFVGELFRLYAPHARAAGNRQLAAAFEARAAASVK